MNPGSHLKHSTDALSDHVPDEHPTSFVASLHSYPALHSLHLLLFCFKFMKSLVSLNNMQVSYATYATSNLRSFNMDFFLYFHM